MGPGRFVRTRVPAKLRLYVAVAAIVLLGTIALVAVAEEPSRLATTGPIPGPITPPSSEQIEKAIRRGVDFLLQDQNENGSWGSATQTKRLNIYAPVPGAHHAFRAAVTGLVISALIESKDDRPRVQDAIDRGQAWMFEHLPHVRRATGKAIYNVWAHAYATQALVDLYDRLGEEDPRRERIKKLIAQQIDLLDRYASVDGGWGYYDKRVHAKQPTTSAISFTTATALIALKEAESLGLSASKKTVDKAVQSLVRQQRSDFSYLYGEYLKSRPMRFINRPAGSLGRSQACNLALRLFGDERVTDEVIETWLNRLFARNGWLGMGRKKPIPHESFAQVAGYFYYYGHYYAARCIELLPTDRRPYFQDHLAHVLIPLQERDGSWWDYPLYNYHQQYGTAMAVSSLVRCRRAE